MAAILETINGPADVQALPAADLPRLAEEIRALIIRTVSLTGGHLAANLGTVELTIALLRAGSDAELPFAPIVAGGPNSANPHANPSDRCLAAGDLVVVDWGASYAGYYSDLTRTLAVGDVETELRQIARIVADANAAGRAAGKPGITAGEVDQAARAVIAAAGYGQFFTHRTGHGLGMETHEQPYMFGENKLRLADGMVYTVEPGIYLPGRGGVRIEDDVVVTADGCESLSSLPRDLYQVG